jgi:uncharacterized RDD family membrane protein YckC
VGPFRRLFAYFLDLFFVGTAIVISFVTLVVVYTFAVVPMLQQLGLAGWSKDLGISLVGMAGLLAAGLFWFYGAFLETYRNGQTWGKRVAGIQVLSTDGYAIDGVQAMTRNLFRYLDILPMIPAGLFYSLDIETSVTWLPTGLIGLLCMAINPRYQRVGDLIAGTMVVLVEKKRATDLANFDDPRVAQLAELIPVDFTTTPSMVEALATFVDARERFSVAHRSEVAAHLAGPLKEQLQFPDDTDNDLLLCALYHRCYTETETSHAL